MTFDLQDEVESIFGLAALNIRRLAGGDVSDVFKVQLADGSLLVAKVDQHNPSRLDIEAMMLNYLATNSNLPVPQVLHNRNGILFLEFVEGNSQFSAKAQVHAAELLGELHWVRGDEYGFDIDTLLGGLHQPNPNTKSWLDFFREHRLLHMAHAAEEAGRLPGEVSRSIGHFCEHLQKWLAEPERPNLVHGDAWSGNILCKDSRITGFLDPAIYFAHREIELAFTTLFNTFGQPFFDRYNEIYPIKPGFFEERRDIYNLYPLLVHVRLFGGGYVEAVRATLKRYGF